MPKRFNDRLRSVFVKFYDDVPDEEVDNDLRSMGVSGSRVSTLVNRWVLDVPFWREEEYVDKLWDNGLVEMVYENADTRRRSFDDQE